MPDFSALARRVWEQVWPANDEALLAAVLHPQFRNHAAPPQWRDGLQGAAAVVHQLNEAFSDLRYVTLQTLVDGDRVAVHNMCTGRHTGPWAGLPVHGRGFSAEQVHILRFDGNGLAIEHWAVRDDLTLLRQLEGPDTRRAPSPARVTGQRTRRALWGDIALGASPPGVHVRREEASRSAMPDPSGRHFGPFSAEVAG